MPSNLEDEYIARKEFEKKQSQLLEQQKNLLKGKKEEAKKLHFMKCPKCGMELIEIDYKNIKIDRCSSCEGLWLDNGELEHVIGLESSALNKFFSIFTKG